MIYWTAIFGHQKCSWRFRRKPECRRVTGTPPGDIVGLMGLSGEREGWPRAGRAHLPLWSTRRGGRRPPFLLPLPLPFPLLVGVGKRGVLLLLGGGGLLLGAPQGAGRPPPLLLYIRGQGGTLGHTSWSTDRSLAVCGAPLHHIPPRSYRRGV